MKQTVSLRHGTDDVEQDGGTLLAEVAADVADRLLLVNHRVGDVPARWHLDGVQVAEEVGILAGKLIDAPRLTADACAERVGL